MNFLMELLGELLLTTSLDAAGNRKASLWKRGLACFILLLFLFLYLFILYGSLSLTILFLQKKEYGSTILMGSVALLVVLWLYLNGRKLWKRYKKA